MYKNIKLKKGQLSKENNMPIRIVKNKPSRKGRSFRNTRRENRLEELGRVDAEKARTSKGKRNLREEKDRIRSELAVGGVAGVAGRRLRKNAHRPKGAPFGGPKAGGRKAGPSPKDLQKIREKMKPKDNARTSERGKSKEKPKTQRPGYSSGGVVMAGKKVGCQIK
jgi:hypothetical protein